MFCIVQSSPTKVDISLEMILGKTLVSRKCSICHNLDRIFGASKNSQEWTSTVGRMAATMDDPDFLSEQEKEAIIAFLSQRKQKEYNNQRSRVLFMIYS